MEIKRISKGEFPPENKYVFIYCSDGYWFDNDPNVFWKVAKMVRGISKQQRDEMLLNDDLEIRKRAGMFYPEDEHGNNTVPYYFQEFGCSNHFGQTIDIWCDPPVIESI